MKLKLSVLLLVISESLVAAQKNTLLKSEPKVPTVAFCQLLRDPDSYDGKEVRFRATYRHGFEASEFFDPGCFGDDKFTNWVEFDDAVKTQMNPETLKKFNEAFCCRTANESLWTMFETELRVLGTLHKPNGKGYGRDSNPHYFLITVKRVEEVGSSKKNDLGKQ